MRGNWQDTLNMAGKVTPRRFWNGLKLLAGYYYSKQTQRPHQWGLPASLSFEPTTACNLRCPECPSGLRSFSRPTGLSDLALYRQIIDELAPTLAYLILYFQGEPYLHKDLFAMIGHAVSRNIYTATSTNAHYLSEENARKTIESGLDRLIISLDGTTQETYQQYRVGGKIDKVLEGTRNIIRLKKAMGSKKPYVVFQFLVVGPNEHQIEEVKQLAREMGVDKVAFKTAQIYDYQNGSPLIPSQDRYSRYRQNPDGTYSIKNRLLNHCWKMWHSCVITWDGKVVPCCFDKDAQHRMGQLGEASFRQVWQGPEYQAFRQALLRSRSEIEMCKNCTEGTRVWG